MHSEQNGAIVASILMKLTRSTSHLILSPDMAALVLCAMRLGLRDTNGRRMGVPKAADMNEQMWTRRGAVHEIGDALYRTGTEQVKRMEIRE